MSKSVSTLRPSPELGSGTIEQEIWDALPDLSRSGKVRIMALAGRLAQCGPLTATELRQLWPNSGTELEGKQEQDNESTDDWEQEQLEAPDDWDELSSEPSAGQHSPTELRFPEEWEDGLGESLAQLDQVDLSFCRLTQTQLSNLLLEPAAKHEKVNLHTRKLSLAGCELSLSPREEQDGTGKETPRWAVVPVLFLTNFIHLRFLSLAGCSSVSVQLGNVAQDSDTTVRHYRHTQILNMLHGALPQLVWLDVSGCPIFDRVVMRLLADGQPEVGKPPNSKWYLPCLRVLDARALPGNTVEPWLERRFYARRVRLLA